MEIFSDLVVKQGRAVEEKKAAWSVGLDKIKAN